MLNFYASYVRLCSQYVDRVFEEIKLKEKKEKSEHKEDAYLDLVWSLS